MPSILGGFFYEVFFKMATPNTITFDQFLIVIGDGGSPEVFAPRCTINLSRSFTITPNYTDQELPDCADDTLPSVIFKILNSVTAEVGGNGIMDIADAKFFSEWLLSGAVKNARVLVGIPAAGYQWDFPAKMGPFSPTVDRNGNATADVSIMSSGSIVGQDYT